MGRLSRYPGSRYFSASDGARGVGGIAGHRAQPAAHRPTRWRAHFVRFRRQTDTDSFAGLCGGSCIAGRVSIVHDQLHQWLYLAGGGRHAVLFRNASSGYLWSLPGRPRADLAGSRCARYLYLVVHGYTRPDQRPVKISATIITYNEERNLPRAIESLRCVEEIIVMDSGSSDRTVEIAEKLGARVVESAWPGYTNQKNLAAERATHDWILSIDA